jgi:hypothetical protein
MDKLIQVHHVLAVIAKNFVVVGMRMQVVVVVVVVAIIILQLVQAVFPLMRLLMVVVTQE